jgi:hypothetical protein
MIMKVEIETEARPLRFQCHNCQVSLYAADMSIGKLVKCRHCRQSSVVPSPERVVFKQPLGTVMPAGLRCEQCDYDLRGLPQNRCPECGYEFQTSLSCVHCGHTLVGCLENACGQCGRRFTPGLHLYYRRSTDNVTHTSGMWVVAGLVVFVALMTSCFFSWLSTLGGMFG